MKLRNPPSLHYGVNLEYGRFKEAKVKLPPGADYITMRAWQEECFEYRKNRYLVVVAPSGSGKSNEIIWIAVDDYLTTGRKQLIVVPQKGISDGFSKKKGKSGVSILYNGTKRIFNPENLCYLTLEESRLEALIDFLNDPAAPIQDDLIISDGCCVTTHQAWVRALNAIYLRDGERGIKKAFQNISIYVDECHHCDSEGWTGMGRYLTMLLHMDIPTLQIRLITATMFRNYGKRIIPKEFDQYFARYTLPFSDYVASTGIKEFYYDFIYYNGNPLDDIVHRISEEPEERHLIILPRTGHGFREFGTLQKLKDMLAQKGFENILDLVTTSNQDKAWRDLCDNPDKYHIVIACKMFDEGKDWPPCNRLYDAGFGVSPVLNYQKPGRTFRIYKGKTVVKIFCYVKQCNWELSDTKLFDFFNDRFNILLTFMLREDMSDPIRIPTLPNKMFIGTDKAPRHTSLHDLFAGTLFFIDLNVAYEACKVKDAVSIRAAAMSVCKKYHNDSIVDEIALDDFIDAAILLLLRANRVYKEGDRERVKGLDLSYLRKEGLANIIEKEPLLGSLVYGTEENILELFPEYIRKLKACSRDIKEIQGRAEIEKHTLESSVRETSPRQTVLPVDDLPVRTWVVLPTPAVDRDGQPLLLKTNIGVVVGANGRDISVNVYPDREIKVIKGRVFLDRRYVWDKDRGAWKRWGWRGTVGMKKVRSPYIKDESISKTIDMDKYIIKPIQGVVYG